MGIKTRMSQQAKPAPTLKEQLRMFSEFMDERNAIADRYLEKWKINVHHVP